MCVDGGKGTEGGVGSLADSRYAYTSDTLTHIKPPAQPTTTHSSILAVDPENGAEEGGGSGGGGGGRRRSSHAG